MEQLTDEEVVASYRQRSEGAERDALLNELFRRHYQRVSLWCLRFTGNRDSAVDMAQEVFLRAFRSIGSYRGEAKFSTWLYTIARNHCFNEMSAKLSRPEQSAEDMLLEIPDPSLDPLAQLEQSTTREFVQELFRESLTELESRIMTLHYAEDMPLDTVSRLLHLENASG